MKKQIQLSLEATYQTLGELSEKTTCVWIACHGYGQLAEYFIKHFECLDLEKNYVIAPQGLAKFYVQGLGGRVGAAWMTTEDRQLEIDNYVKMLSAIYTEELQGKKVPVVLFGFSQGAATIARFAMLTELPFDAFVLWGGHFPPDIDYAKAVSRLEKKPFLMYIGTEDKFISAEQREEHLELLQHHGLQPELTVYEGEHKLYGPVLKDMEEQLRGCLL